MAATGWFALGVVRKYAGPLEDHVGVQTVLGTSAVVVVARLMEFYVIRTVSIVIERASHSRQQTP